MIAFNSLQAFANFSSFQKFKMAPKPPSPRKTVVGIDFGKLVYVPHEIDGFQLGKLVDIRSDGLAVEVLGTQDIIKVDHDEVFPADDNQRTDVDDNCKP